MACSSTDIFITLSITLSYIIIQYSLNNSHLQKYEYDYNKYTTNNYTTQMYVITCKTNNTIQLSFIIDSLCNTLVYYNNDDNRNICYNNCSNYYCNDTNYEYIKTSFCNSVIHEFPNIGYSNYTNKTILEYYNNYIDTITNYYHYKHISLLTFIFLFIFGIPTLIIIFYNFYNIIQILFLEIALGKIEHVFNS
jgi:hypothetical protein